jgi:hypothetical protein
MYPDRSFDAEPALPSGSSWPGPSETPMWPGRVRPSRARAVPDLADVAAPGVVAAGRSGELVNAAVLNGIRVRVHRRRGRTCP